MKGYNGYCLWVVEVKWYAAGVWIPSPGWVRSSREQARVLQRYLRGHLRSRGRKDHPGAELRVREYIRWGA
jgi:hypothetical protein